MFTTRAERSGSEPALASVRLVANLVAAAGVASLLLAARPALAQAAARCTLFDVGHPTRIVDGEGRPLYLDLPVAVRTGPDIALFSRNTMLWRNATTLLDTVGMIELARKGQYVESDTLAGVVMHANGVASLLGRPKGQTGKPEVRAISDSQGGAWVGWLAGNDSGSFTDVWIARFQKGKWGRLEHPIHTSMLVPNALSMALAGRAPIIVVAGVGTEFPRAPQGIRLALKSDTGWVLRWLNTGFYHPWNIQIARSGSGRLIIAYSGSFMKGTRGPDSNAVFVATSQDEGRSWSDFHMAVSTENTRVNWLSLLAAPGDTLHITWRSDLGQASAVRMMHAMSADGGVTWQQMHDVAVPAPLSTTTTVTQHGLTLSTRDTEENEIALVDLRSNEAPAVMRLPWQNTLPQSATTFGNPRSPIFLTWSELVPHAYAQFPAIAAPRTLYTWIRPCNP